jgi:ERCC4-related helicase
LTSWAQIIENFKNGRFNVLVCTSIGEEGLDIGEVDFIVCYDSKKTPISMVCMSPLAIDEVS